MKWKVLFVIKCQKYRRWLAKLLGIFVLILISLIATAHMPYGWPEEWATARNIGSGFREHGFKVTGADSVPYLYWVAEGDDKPVLRMTRLADPVDSGSVIEIPWGEDGPCSGEFQICAEELYVFWVEEEGGRWHLRVAETDLCSEVGPVETIYSSPNRLRHLAVAGRQDNCTIAWSERYDGALQIRVAELSELVRPSEKPRTVTSTDIPSRFPFLSAAGNETLLGWVDQRTGGVSTIRAKLLDPDSDTSALDIGSVVFSDDHGRPVAVNIESEGGKIFMVVWSGGEVEDGIPTDRAILASRIITVCENLCPDEKKILLEQRGLDAVQLFPALYSHQQKVALSWSQQRYNDRYERNEVSGYLCIAEADGCDVSFSEPTLLTYGFRNALRPRVAIDDEGHHHYIWQTAGEAGRIDLYYTNDISPASVTRWNVLGIDSNRVIPSALFQVLLAGIWAVARMGREIILLCVFGAVLWVAFGQNIVVSLSAYARIGVFSGVGMLYGLLSYLGVLVVPLDLWGMEPTATAAAVAAGVTLLVACAFCLTRKASHMLTTPLQAVGCFILWVFWNSYFQLLFVPLALR